MGSKLLRVLTAAALLVGLATACSKSGDQPTSREFGVATDPWHIDDWSTAIGAKPTMVMEFESWNRNRTLDTHFEEARKVGLQSFMITWEPWAPVDSSLPTDQQAAIQPAYSNAAIASGKQDAYIKMFAHSVAQAQMTVYIRYAHEMNGDWYPWVHDPVGYVAAWRHVVDIFRAEGATNAKFIFSMNPSLFLDDATFLKGPQPYWPGANYVDYIGSTMINFGGSKQDGVARFADRIRLMHSTYNKPVILTEVNTAAQGRVTWFKDLRSWLAQDSAWLKGAVLSQGKSRAKATLGDVVGNVDWDVTTDASTRPVLASIISDIRASP